ncbi:MAG TPA: pyruvate dehydrogenase complex dihydrolipoamide acetyltransferase [Stellaceae bacterium]|nr:pyruvate dehydrogenase complex dihydrolipoamide acetyltransferase [Stellaceae bacterium]HMD65357.1 pyruvate dehydrogenase complex dihydrolipoamide acetyltransferase [Stellaceae bacterium]
MPIEILMPALSPTMTEGNLAKWLKKEGDEVHSGDVLAEIETDKATMEVEAVDEGKIGKILVPEGAQGIKVNAPIAVLLGEGEDASALEKFAESVPRPTPVAPPSQESVQPAPAAPAVPGRERGNGRVFASPLARRMAQQAGLDLGAIRGSGPQGRIVKSDIEAALSAGRAAPAPAPVRPAPVAQPAPPAAPVLSKERVAALAGNPPYNERPLNAMRRVIARRLTESKQTVPHFYLTIDCEVDALLKIRTELNAKSDAYRISVNDFVIRAAALGLRQVPAANASWSDDAILLWDTVDIAVAVALDDGLITPIVKMADRKGLAAIANETRDLVARARAGKLKLEEFQGGTFSISNLGMYGVRDFAAVINPPHGGILAVGAGEQRPVVKNGALAVATVMSCTLSCDHRAVDGAVGAQFLAAFKKLVEDPLTMLL